MTNSVGKASCSIADAMGAGAKGVDVLWNLTYVISLKQKRGACDLQPL